MLLDPASRAAGRRRAAPPRPLHPPCPPRRRGATGRSGGRAHGCAGRAAGLFLPSPRSRDRARWGGGLPAGEAGLWGLWQPPPRPCPGHRAAGDGAGGPRDRCKESTCLVEEMLLIKRGNDLPLRWGEVRQVVLRSRLRSSLQSRFGPRCQTRIKLWQWEG